jgi:hypothetical protein
MSDWRQSFVVMSKKRDWQEPTQAVEQQKAPDEDDIIDLTTAPLPPPATKRAKSTTAATNAIAAALSTAAPPPPPAAIIKRAQINEWVGLPTLVRETGLRSVTCVDPGTRNCAVSRIVFTPKTRITHAKVIDMDELIVDYEARHPTVHLSASSGVTEKRLFAWQEFVRHEMQPGGCFDSDVLLCEDQAHIFDPVMGRVEAVTVALFNAQRPPINVTSASALPAGQIITARSIKACYRPLFPELGDGASAADQRLENKKNAKKYGALIVPQKRLAEIVENLTERDRKRLAKAQMHDFFDCFFMSTWFVSCFMFNVYKLRRDRPDADNVGAFDKPPQRSRNRWQELIEIAHDLGTPAANIETLMTVLTGALEDAVE